MFGSKAKILVCFVLCFAFIAFLFTGCGNKDAAGDTTGDATGSVTEKVKLRVATWWGPERPWEPLIQKYKEDNKDRVELVYEYVQGDEMRTKIKIDAAGGNCPDLFNWWGPVSLLGPLVKGNIALDVDEFFAKSKVTKKEDWDPSAIDVFRSPVDGKVYGLPFSGSLGFFMVNKKMFEQYNLKYPKTWDDFIAVSKVFRDNGIIPFAMTSKGGNPSHFYFSYLFCQFAGSREDLTVALKKDYKFDTDNCLKTAKLIDEQRKLKMFPDDTMANGDWSPCFALFAEKKAAMTFSYPWMLGSLPKEMYDEVEYVDFPKHPDAAYDPAEFVSRQGNGGMVISRVSFKDLKRQAELTKLVDFYFSDEMFAIAVEAGEVISKNAKVDPKYFSPMLTRLFDYSEGKEGVGCHYTNFPDPIAFNLFQTTLDELWAGTISPEDFVEKIQDELDKAER